MAGVGLAGLEVGGGEDLGCFCLLVVGVGDHLEVLGGQERAFSGDGVLDGGDGQAGHVEGCLGDGLGLFHGGVAGVYGVADIGQVLWRDGARAGSGGNDWG